MINCYSWPTPNGIKVHIMLEETGLDYKVFGIDISKGDQFKPSFLKISPNNKMPAIIDKEGPSGKPISVFESGAILIYLSEKTGKFMPKQSYKKYEVIQWLMFQIGSIGPMLGQSNFFRHYCPEKIPYAIKRYSNEVNRLYGVLDKRLQNNKFLAADKYTIADMSVWPWIIPYYQGAKLSDYKYLSKWYYEIEKRKAVLSALKVLSDRQMPGKEIKMDKAAKERLYGKTQRDAAKIKI
ncbi:glutathione S-transferase N-terminal domain-containing protein [Alphaproteobacteria bacterium]|nr:glutathione S-transferase N-terminal domain-containing protein [Alphaproteobacteria bacterium]